MTDSMSFLLRRLGLLALLSLVSIASPAMADEPTKPVEAAKADVAKADAPKAEQSVTQGRVPTLAGGYVESAEAGDELEPTEGPTE